MWQSSNILSICSKLSQVFSPHRFFSLQALDKLIQLKEKKLEFTRLCYHETGLFFQFRKTLELCSWKIRRCQLHFERGSYRISFRIMLKDYCKKKTQPKNTLDAPTYVPDISRQKRIILFPRWCSAKCRTAGLCLWKFIGLSYETVPYPPYSPGLSPTYYHIFKRVNFFPNNDCLSNQAHVEATFGDLMDSTTSEPFATGINKRFVIGKNEQILVILNSTEKFHSEMR